MKNFLILIFITITLILSGCGGGGSENKKTSTIPTKTTSQSNYSKIDSTNYIVPNTSDKHISTRSIKSTGYQATYRAVDSKTVVETPENANGESVEYKTFPDKIHVTFKDANNNPIYSYDIKKNIQIGKSITVQDSACIFMKKFPQKDLDGTTYTDVIEIDCGKNKGFYAKNKGLVAQY